MSDFLDKMLKGNGEPEREKRMKVVGAKVMMASEQPDLATAIETLLFYAINGLVAQGRGVREVGEKCTVFIGGMQVAAVDRVKGTIDENAINGDFQITVERVK
jgi:hypothetical protein